MPFAVTVARIRSARRGILARDCAGTRAGHPGDNCRRRRADRGGNPCRRVENEPATIRGHRRRGQPLHRRCGQRPYPANRCRHRHGNHSCRNRHIRILWRWRPGHRRTAQQAAGGCLRRIRQPLHRRCGQRPHPACRRPHRYHHNHRRYGRPRLWRGRRTGHSGRLQRNRRHSGRWRCCPLRLRRHPAGRNRGQPSGAADRPGLGDHRNRGRKRKPRLFRRRGTGHRRRTDHRRHRPGRIRQPLHRRF